MSIKINGVEIGIPGPAGKSAYQAAKDAGFTGSETEFNQSIASVKDKQNKLSGTQGQIVGFNENGDAVAQSKPTYTASEVGALPSSTSIPSKTSQLTNDSGFITGYTETDPTVPSWAKASSKPTYTASEVGAAPSSHASDSNIHITSDERTAWNAKLDASQKGTAGGVATLGSDGKVPTAQLPNTGLMPELIVTVDAGSVITAVCGDQTVTATATDGTAVMALPGYGTWTVSATKDGETSREAVISVDAVKRYAVSLTYAKIYGAVWDGEIMTAWSRTDDAACFVDPVPYVKGAASYGSPFDDLYPWSGMVRVTDPEAGELVAIPKFWYKWTKSGNSLKLQIANKPVDGFFVSPAHADRGDGKGERDVVYVGRYHCHTSNYKSQTGGNPKTNITRSAARSGIHNLGATIWQFDMAMRVTIQMLYLVEFADWDSQLKIGYGCGNNSAAQNVGASDSMPYHTGTMQNGRRTYGVGVQYRYIEGLWDNVYEWLDGCYHNDNGLNIINNPANFSDSAGGTAVGMPTEGYPTVMSVATLPGMEWVIYANKDGGGDFTYVPDYWFFDGSCPCLFVGGYYNQGLDCGLFCVYCNSASTADATVGCRLQKLP